ncbi:hypothetical protein [Vibrio marisflavi]|uniref:Uncharacterized protein n=1 Tax=Vibrio marisflavi CECT 7928 TaxID=634439 RepID=A0ABM9A962_9VIBR|nr:hypothetical protein [Vibrio marisflavi]CAH0542937.1 hypothetical protein VMF7928_04315 [Vibrio marisflavi CECT 7928]
MIPAVGGGLTNSGSMPISGGDAGPSTASSGNYSGQTIGAINMGSQGISPWLLGIVVLAIGYWMLKK